LALTERLALLVTLDANGAVKGFNDLGKAADRNLGKSDQRIDQFASKFQKAGAGMLAGAGLAAAGLYKAGQAAAGLEQAVGGTSAVFGDTSAKIDKFAKGAAQAMGLSEREFREATTSIGGQLKGLGFSVEKAADQSVSLTRVAADLAATYGGTTAEAVQALGAAFRGEADPAERFNLFLNQTRVNAKAVELGLAASTSQVSANAKAQATLALITEQSADAQGQFAREANTAAGAQARMKAELENTVAALGQGVAPIIGDLASGVGGLAAKFNDLPGPVQNTVSKVATYGTIATGALGATSLLVGKVLEGRQRFSDLADQLPRTSRALTGLGKAAATLGPLLALESLDPLAFLNGAAPDVEKLENALARIAVNKSIEGLGLDFDKLGNAIERVSDPSVATRVSDTAAKLATLGGALDFGKTSNLDEARQQVDALDQAMAALAARDPATASAALNEVADRLGVSVGDLVPLLDAYETTLSAADTEQQLATSSMERLGDAGKTAAGHIGEVKTRFDELTDALRASVDADFAYDDAIAATAEAVRRLSEEAPRAIADARAGLRRAEQDLARAQSETIDPKLEGQDRAAAEQDRARLIEDRKRAVVDAGRAIEDAERGIADATRDARDALLAEADAAVVAADEAFLLADKTLTAAQKQQIFRDRLAELTADLRGPLKTELDEVIARMDNLARDRRASLELEIRESRFAIAVSRDAELNQGRAIGGPVTANQTYRVNENNPSGEFFTPSVNGTITPGGPMTSGATSQVNNITINNPSQEPASTSIRKVRSELAA
jgi:hypothetical protein